MERLLVIDLPAKVARAGDQVLDGQWFIFVAMLALGRSAGSEDLPVTITGLARVDPWCRKKPESIGKEVSRKLGDSKGSPIARYFDFQVKTQAWRLEVEPASILFVPSRAEVEQWVVEQAVQPVTSEHIEALDVLLHATIKYQVGFPEKARELLEARPDRTRATEPALEGWRAVLEARIAARLDEPETVSRIARAWAPRADLVGSAVNARLHGLLALLQRFNHAGKALTSLSRLESVLETRGDAGSTAVVLNVMGLLDRRRGRADAAGWRLLRSAALHGLAENFDGLSSALFNLALALHSAQPDVPPGRDIFLLIDLCLRASHVFGVGYYTAQASITAARWSVKAGNAPRARAYLRGAETSVRRQLPSADLAYYHLALAEIEMLEGAPADQIRRNLDVALRGAADAQDTATMDLITRHLDTLSASSSVPVKGGRRAKDRPER